MLGRAYTFFDTAIGQCAIAWGEAGIVGVPHPRPARSKPTGGSSTFIPKPAKRDQRPMPKPRSKASSRYCAEAMADFADVMLDMGGHSRFSISASIGSSERIPHGETRTYNEVTSQARNSERGALGRPRPYPQPLCRHRSLSSRARGGRLLPPDVAHGGLISKRRLLSIEGAISSSSKTLLDVLLPIAPPRLPG